MALKPLGQRVLVKQKKEEPKSAIIVDDDLKKALPRGTVLAISDEVQGVKVDDEVLFSDFAGEKVEDDGNEYLIIKTSELIAICLKNIDHLS